MKQVTTGVSLRPHSVIPQFHKTLSKTSSRLTLLSIVGAIACLPIPSAFGEELVKERTVKLINSVENTSIASTSVASTSIETASGEKAKGEGQAIELNAADGAKIFAMHYQAQHPRAIILLFHQGNGNYGEYRNIGPRLADESYSALAIDERHGANAFGKRNDTIHLLGKSSRNIDALIDLEASLQWALTQKLPVVIWGSSDSASLIFGLSAKYPDVIKAVLSFSPELTDVELPDWTSKAAAKTLAPVFITSASTDQEQANAQDLFKVVGSAKKIQYRAKTKGIHGSSTLDKTRNPVGAEENWLAVSDFLRDALE